MNISNGQKHRIHLGLYMVSLMRHPQLNNLTWKLASQSSRPNTTSFLVKHARRPLALCPAFGAPALCRGLSGVKWKMYISNSNTSLCCYLDI